MPINRYNMYTVYDLYSSGALCIAVQWYMRVLLMICIHGE